jgi:hypothetical protein
MPMQKGSWNLFLQSSIKERMLPSETRAAEAGRPRPWATGMGAEISEWLRVTAP